jgi:deazaflavin-dependent oxidoreductase (nitroreductase family)
MAQPGPILRRALRLPVGLYGIGAGRLLGHRFLLLTHRGRRSGRVYRTMLEVVRWNPDRREAIVMSGFGPKANWRLNVLGGGAVDVQIAGLSFAPAVRELGQGEAADVVADYERRNRLVRPIVRTMFSRLSGTRYDGSPEVRRRLVEALPLLGFSQRPDGDAGP